MESGKTKKVVRGALLLTIAGLISKVLSATYRIPLQNFTGDIGFFTYQQIYPLIGMAMIISLYGFPVAVSKLVAENKALGKNNMSRNIYRPIFIILLAMSMMIALLIYFLAPYITTWMETPQLLETYQLAAALFILLPFISMLRGVFQGQEKMASTAYSQIVEQVIRVTLIIVASYFVFIEKMDVNAIGKAGVTASLIGTGVVTCVWLVYLIRKKKPSQIKQKSIPWAYYIRVCFSLGIVAALSHMILILFQLVDVFTIVPGLMKDGLSQMEAMKWKGIFDRGQPLIQFGVVFGSSFALALVPTVVQEGKNRAIAIREALLFSFYLSGAATVGLIVMMPEVNALLFMNTSGTDSLQVLSLSIILSAMGVTICSILQNIGDVWKVATWIVIALIVKGLLNIMLVPMFEIKGSAMATVISLLVMGIAVFVLLARRLPELQFFRHIRWGVFITANIMMVAFLLLIKYSLYIHIAFSRTGLLIYVFLVIIIGAAIYMLILLRYGVLSNKQIQALPFSGSIQRLSKLLVKKEDEYDI